MNTKILKRGFVLLIFVALVLISTTESAYAYIGPGAGFAFVSSFFILLITFFLALLTFLFWPIRFLVKTFRKKRPLHTKYDVKRVVIVGLDGMDPGLASQYMREGKLPNLSKLSKSGTFQKLQTTLPAMWPGQPL